MWTSFVYCEIENLKINFSTLLKMKSLNILSFPNYFLTMISAVLRSSFLLRCFIQAGMIVINLSKNSGSHFCQLKTTFPSSSSSYLSYMSRRSANSLASSLWITLRRYLEQSCHICSLSNLNWSKINTVYKRCFLFILGIIGANFSMQPTVEGWLFQLCSLFLSLLFSSIKPANISVNFSYLQLSKLSKISLPLICLKTMQSLRGKRWF